MDCSKSGMNQYVYAGHSFFLINSNSLKVTLLPENTGDSEVKYDPLNTFICSIFIQNATAIQND